MGAVRTKKQMLMERVCRVSRPDVRKYNNSTEMIVSNDLSRE